MATFDLQLPFDLQGDQPQAVSELTAGLRRGDPAASRATISLGRALNVVFATAKGNVRRNSMDAFANIPSNGKYAMRFEEGSEDRLIGVALLESGDDVLLASRDGKAIRFDGEDVREFVSRTSTGVRGMRLKGDDEVVSLSILHRVGVNDQEERDNYLRFAPWKAEKEGEPNIAPERFAGAYAKVLRGAVERARTG